ncbi:MAG: glycosyltransferase family 39 protein, partial [Verrucomicrobiaceae bacterium]|nr:glycosyltransferase family 39 protein [Verrucomicrobiaceae bacterium]
MSYTRAVWSFLFCLTAIRLTLLGTTDLSFDEAHYWMWSDRLAPAYFSKGPGVAFAIRASTALFGDSEFGVRFWSPILGAATCLLVYYFTRRLFSERAGFWAVIALNAIPLFNVGNLVMTIDPLSIFFWTAAMITFWAALERSPQSIWLWPATGLLIGLGFLCKYTNALQLVSVLLVLALIPRHRREFKRRGLYLLLGAFAICLVPPIVWNAQHAWITFSHLRSRGGLDQSLGVRPLETLGFLGAHFLTFSPLLFIALVWAVVANWRRARQQFKVLYLVWFGLPVFLFYLVISFNDQAAPNWDVLAFVSLAVLAAAFWTERLEASGAVRRFLYVGVLLGVALSLFALNTDLLRTLNIPFPHHRDPADRARGWKSAARAVEKIRAEYEPKIGEKVFIIADQRDRASEMSFYFNHKRVEGPGHPPVYIVESQDIENQFSFWPRYDEFVEAPPNTPLPDGEVYTEEGGINPFTGRSALYV